MKAKELDYEYGECTREQMLAYLTKVQSLQKEAAGKMTVDVHLLNDHGAIFGGGVHHFDGDNLAAIHYNDPKGVPMCYYASASGLEAGDKVKIYIFKED